MNRATIRKYSLRQWIFALIYGLIGPLVIPSHTAEFATPPPPEAEYTLRLFHTHTNQHLEVVYRVGDRYLPEAMQELEDFLGDFRTGSTKPFDPRLFDLLVDLTKAAGKPDAEINILSAYRSPESNAFLRRASSGVAKRSLHMQAEAMDIRVPDVKTSQLRKLAMNMKRGGVGYYPRSNFVHVDVGEVRHW